MVYRPGPGELGLLDPATGTSQMIDLGEGSRPHGVITAADGAAWVTDGGRNSIIRVDAATEEITEYPLPDDAADANLNTAVIDPAGVLWFTGQSGWYGKVDRDGTVAVYEAPEGRGPYGITVTPDGTIFYASLAGSYVGQVDPATGDVTVLEPPVPDQGSRRVWSDSSGKVWVSAWESGDVLVYDPSTGEWHSWRLPGENPAPYAVFVDETDAVWLSDFGANALVRFDPATKMFTSIPLPSPNGEGANFTADPVRCGVPSRPPTNSSSCEPPDPRGPGSSRGAPALDRVPHTRIDQRLAS